MKILFQKLASIPPRKWFLIDGVGALFSAFMLGVVLVKLEPIFGIPKEVLYLLAIIPCFFALYDLGCYILIKTNHGIFLGILAILNVSYCILSLGLAVLHSNKVTIYGWCYIVIEILIVGVISYYEFMAGSRENRTNKNNFQ